MMRTIPEHLVLISPFFMDRMEITVAEARALHDAHPEIAQPAAPGAVGVDASPFCTFAASSDGALPVNCPIMRPLRRSARRAAPGCRRRRSGSSRPATGRSGPRSPGATGAVFATTPSSSAGDANLLPRAASRIRAPCPPGFGAGGSPADRTQLGIQDLGGSVTEWVADSFERYDEGCWATPGLLLDPMCSTEKPEAVVRGASFADLGSYARAAQRRGGAEEREIGADRGAVREGRALTIERRTSAPRAPGHVDERQPPHCWTHCCGRAHRERVEQRLPFGVRGDTILPAGRVVVAGAEAVQREEARGVDHARRVFTRSTPDTGTSLHGLGTLHAPATAQLTLAHA